MNLPDFKLLDEQIRSTDLSVAQSAERVLTPLADAGNVEAAGILSTAYSDGMPNIAADLIKAYRYTEICAEAGDAFSRYWLARLQHRAGDFAAALKNLRLAVEAGDNQAPTLLATMLIRGEGCPPSIMEGLSLLEKASASATDAQALLARFYAFGEYVDENPRKAHEYMQRIHEGTFAFLKRFSPEKAAEIYYVKGMILRMLAEAGDPVEAWRPCIEQAAQLGDAQAKQLLANERGGGASKMESTVSGQFTATKISDTETEISFKCIRPWALVMIAFGALLSVTFVGMFIGLPMVFAGLVGAIFRKRGSITFVRGQGVKFPSTFGDGKIPFSDISRVGWKKTHVFFNVFDLTVDTKGASITIARGLSLAMAQELQGLLLRA